MREENKKRKQGKKSDETYGKQWKQNKTLQYLHMKIPEEEKERGTKSIVKAIMAENFQNLGREMDIQIMRPQICWTQNGLH